MARKEPTVDPRRCLPRFYTNATPLGRPAVASQLALFEERSVTGVSSALIEHSQPKASGGSLASSPDGVRRVTRSAGGFALKRPRLRPNPVPEAAETLERLVSPRIATVRRAASS